MDFEIPKGAILTEGPYGAYMYEKDKEEDQEKEDDMWITNP